MTEVPRFVNETRGGNRHVVRVASPRGHALIPWRPAHFREIAAAIVAGAARCNVPRDGFVPFLPTGNARSYGRNDAAGLATQLKRQRRAKVAILSGAHVDIVTPDARCINLQKHFSWRQFGHGYFFQA